MDSHVTIENLLNVSEANSTSIADLLEDYRKLQDYVGELQTTVTTLAATVDRLSALQE